jgi:hypothetical protein
MRNELKNKINKVKADIEKENAVADEPESNQGEDNQGINADQDEESINNISRSV